MMRQDSTSRVKVLSRDHSSSASGSSLWRAKPAAAKRERRSSSAQNRSWGSTNPSGTGGSLAGDPPSPSFGVRLLGVEHGVVLEFGPRAEDRLEFAGGVGRAAHVVRGVGRGLAGEPGHDVQLLGRHRGEPRVVRDTGEALLEDSEALGEGAFVLRVAAHVLGGELAGKRVTEGGDDERAGRHGRRGLR